MANTERRAAERRRAWGRGPMILRFEPLEGRQLLATLAATGTAGGAATTAVGGGAAPDLVVADFNGPTSLAWGDTFHAIGDVANQGGSTTAATTTVQVYASGTPTIGAGAVLVGTLSIPAGIAPGSMAHFDQVLTAPAAAPAGVAVGSTYYLSLRVNAGQTVAESRVDNNQAPGGFQGYAPVTVAPSRSPLLSVSSLSATPTAAGWGSQVSLGATIANLGEGPAPATRARVVLSPYGVSPGGPADVTIAGLDVPAIGAGQSSVLSTGVGLPSMIPASLAGAKQVVLSLVLDADHLTSTATAPASRGLGADAVLLTPAAGTGAATDASTLPALSVATVQVPSLALRYGRPFQVSALVQNTGKADAGPLKVRFALIDDSNPAQPPIALADASLPGLQAGYAQDVVQTIPFPSRMAAGLPAGSTVNAHVVVTVDPDHAVATGSRANESLSGPAEGVSLATTPAGSAPLAADGPVVRSPALPATAAAGTPAAASAGTTSTAVTAAALPALTPAQQRTAALAAAKVRREAAKADAAVARAKVRARNLANAQALAAARHRVKSPRS